MGEGELSESGECVADGEQMTTPLPCPFCGNEDVKLFPAVQSHWYQCPNCYTDGPTDRAVEDMSALWNRRVASDVLNEKGLLSCPFCGSGETYVQSNERHTVFNGQCDCDGCGPIAPTKEQAVVLWNTRARAGE